MSFEILVALGFAFGIGFGYFVQRSGLCFAVGLAEHDVRPREALGKLAKKTLKLVAPKLAKEAAVSLELSAQIA